jgi:hypothetical protein
MIVCTSLGVLPGSFLLLGHNLLLDLGLLVELVEIVDDNGDGEGDTEHPADGAGCTGTTQPRIRLCFVM